MIVSRPMRSTVISLLGTFAAASVLACSGGAASTTTHGGQAATGPASGSGSSGSGSGGAPSTGSGDGAAQLPLVLVADAPLPGPPVRFDYQDIDPAHGHLIVAHMNDASVVVADLKDGSVVKVVPNVPTARGVIVAGDVGRIFVTSSPNKVVILDSATLEEIGRVTTGSSPDGVGWDPAHKTLGVSDQADGAVSLIQGSGSGARTQVKLGAETGNVVFDPTRGRFWVTVVTGFAPDQLMAIDPVAAAVVTKIPLPGCSGAHGLRLHPDGKSAFVACEENSVLCRVDLTGASPIVAAKTGADPDVLSVDPGLGWIYVSAESGDLTVFDIFKPGLVKIDGEHPGDHAHSVAVDPSNHHVFFPLQSGPNGTPVLRIMRPAGT